MADASSSFIGLDPCPPSYSPNSPSSSSAAPELTASSSSSFASTPSLDLTPPTPPDTITRLASGQTPLLFSSPKVIHQHGVFPTDEKRDGVPRGATGELSLTKDGVHITLLQKFVFLHPPGINETGEVVREGKDGRVNGFVQVTAAREKRIEGIRVSLVGRQKLYFPSDGGRAEDTEILMREIVLGGPGTDGIQLKAGLNSFEFSFTVPASTAIHNRTPCGTARHDVRAQLLGEKTGFFGRTEMEDEAVLKLISVPSRDEGLFSLALTHTTLHPTLGPMLVRLSSSQLTVGAALDVLIHLPSPPPGLTVFAASVYVIQTVEITSDRDGEKSHRLVRPKAYAMMEGAEGPYAAKDAAARMRKRKGSVLWEGGDKRKGQVRGEEGWRLEKMARMPDDFHTRPTTHAGTVSSLRVSNEIVVELVYSFPPTSPGLPETVMIATLIRQPIVICSCCAFPDSVVLPSYSPSEPQPFTFPWDPCPCVCNEPWDRLEARELLFRKARQEREQLENGTGAEGEAGRSKVGEEPNTTRSDVGA